MMLNETIARIRSGHLMVRSAEKWDQLSAALGQAYDSKDDELIEQLRSPFLQSWRVMTTNVLRDTFDAAGITVTAPEHPWGIATLAGNGRSCEPLLCAAADTVEGRAEVAVRWPPAAELRRNYDLLRNLHQQAPGWRPTARIYFQAGKESPSNSSPTTRPGAPTPARKVVRSPEHEAYLRTQEWGETKGDEDLSL